MGYQLTNLPQEAHLLITDEPNQLILKMPTIYLIESGSDPLINPHENLIILEKPPDIGILHQAMQQMQAHVI